MQAPGPQEEHRAAQPYLCEVGVLGPESMSTISTCEQFFVIKRPSSRRGCCSHVVITSMGPSGVHDSTYTLMASYTHVMLQHKSIARKPGLTNTHSCCTGYPSNCMPEVPPKHGSSRTCEELVGADTMCTRSTGHLSTEVVALIRVGWLCMWTCAASMCQHLLASASMRR